MPHLAKGNRKPNLKKVSQRKRKNIKGLRADNRARLSSKK